MGTLFWCWISAVGLARPSKKLVKVKLVKLVTQFLKVRDPPPPSAATCHGHAHPPSSGLRQEPGLDFERPHSGPELIFCDRKLFPPRNLGYFSAQSGNKLQKYAVRSTLMMLMQSKNNWSISISLFIYFQFCWNLSKFSCIPKQLNRKILELHFQLW